MYVQINCIDRVIHNKEFHKHWVVWNFLRVHQRDATWIPTFFYPPACPLQNNIGYINQLSNVTGTRVGPTISVNFSLVEWPWDICTSKCMNQHWVQNRCPQARLRNLSGKYGMIQTGHVTRAPRLHIGSGWVDAFILEAINSREASVLYSLIMEEMFHSWVWSNTFANDGIICNQNQAILAIIDSKVNSTFKFLPHYLYKATYFLPYFTVCSRK